MQVSVIIAVYNRAPLLNELLDQWRKVDKETKYKYEIIFTDDESNDNSVKILEGCTDLPIKVIKNVHGGAAKARNSAYKYATGEIIIFTGDDIFPSNNFINDHYETYLRNGENYATLGRIEWRDGIKMNHLMKHITDIGCEQFGFVGMRPYDIIDFRHFYTSNISVSRKKLQELKCLFDTSFEKYGFEDVELGYRLYKNGVMIYYNPSIVCFHDHIYDSVDKFCIRQLSAGEELNTFKQLHPELDEQEIKFDINNFIKGFEEYYAKEPAIEIICDLIRACIYTSKAITKILEVLIQKTDATILKKICSKLYKIIFSYNMYVGLAKGNKKFKNVKLRTAQRFVIRYLLYGTAQIFFDCSNHFTEDKSVKLNTYGRKIIELKYDMSGYNAKRIRFDPLDNICNVKILKTEALLKDGMILDIPFTFTNANRFSKNKFEFTTEKDPILISECLADEIQEINIMYSLNYKKIKRFINLIKKVMRYSIKALKKIFKYLKYRKKKSSNVDINNFQQDRKIWIQIKCEVQDRDIINQYKDICEKLKSVVISDEECKDNNYECYVYRISNARYAMEKIQFFNVIFCLMVYNYDFIVLSDNLEYFPNVYFNTIDDAMIVSKSIGNIENLFRSNMDVKGRYIRIPGSKRIKETININDLCSTMNISNDKELIIGNGKIIETHNDYIVDTINKKKPIIIIFPVFMAVGGVERNTVEVMMRLKDLYDFVIVTFEYHRKEQGSLYYQIANSVITYIDLAEISEFNEYISILNKIKIMYEPDVVWICNSSPWFMEHSKDIRNIFNNSPIIDQDVYDYTYGWIEYYDRPEIYAYDRFIAVNEKIKEKFIKQFGIKSDDIDLVYSAIDVTNIKKINNSNISRESILKKYNLEYDKKYFAFIGRFTEQKQPHKIVELAQYVMNKYDDIKFIMAGDGELSQEIDNLISQYKLQDKVIRIKYIANTVEFLSVMDGIMINSIFEGLPIVTIEAMCVGTPILATDVGDLKLFVDKYNIGVISNSHEIKDINTAFDKFYSNLEEYKNNTKIHMKDNIEFFSSERAAKLMNESFIKAMEKYNKKYTR